MRGRNFPAPVFRGNPLFFSHPHPSMKDRPPPTRAGPRPARAEQPTVSPLSSSRRDKTTNPARSPRSCVLDDSPVQRLIVPAVLLGQCPKPPDRKRASRHPVGGRMILRLSRRLRQAFVAKRDGGRPASSRSTRQASRRPGKGIARASVPSPLSQRPDPRERDGHLPARPCGPGGGPPVHAAWSKRSGPSRR
jgi:hypothetical protein